MNYRIMIDTGGKNSSHILIPLSYSVVNISSTVAIVLNVTQKVFFFREVELLVK